MTTQQKETPTPLSRSLLSHIAGMVEKSAVRDRWVAYEDAKKELRKACDTEAQYWAAVNEYVRAARI